MNHNFLIILILTSFLFIPLRSSASPNCHRCTLALGEVSVSHRSKAGAPLIRLLVAGSSHLPKKGAVDIFVTFSDKVPETKVKKLPQGRKDEYTSYIDQTGRLKGEVVLKDVLLKDFSRCCSAKGHGPLSVLLEINESDISKLRAAIQKGTISILTRS